MSSSTGPTVAAAAPAGTWTAGGALPAAACWLGQHDGAVALDGGGRVLVAGGAGVSGSGLTLSAVYTVAAKTWGPAGALSTARRLHSLTRLSDGSVLAVGGITGPSAGPGLASAERYDAGTGTWTPTGSLATARWGHAAALLPDGSVLVAGGSTVRAGGTVAALRSAERYDPDSGTWSPAADMTDARTGHTAVPLAGAVLVCGGVAPVGTADDAALAFCETYDPAHDRWAPTGSLGRARRHHAAVALTTSTVLVTGGTAPGAPGGGPFDPFSQRGAEVFDKTGGTWTAVADMPSGRAFHRALLPAAGSALLPGGAATDRNEAGYRSVVAYDVAGDSWAVAAGLATGRWGYAAAALPGGTVVVAGGIARSGLAAADPGSTELTATTEVFGS
jgi:hypothetical protein